MRKATALSTHSRQIEADSLLRNGQWEEVGRMRDIIAGENKTEWNLPVRAIRMFIYFKKFICFMN